MRPTLRAGGRRLLIAFVAGLLLADSADAACIAQPIMGGADPAVIYTNGFTNNQWRVTLPVAPSGSRFYRLQTQ